MTDRPTPERAESEARSKLRAELPKQFELSHQTVNLIAEVLKSRTGGPLAILGAVLDVINTACTNGKGVPEATLDQAVLDALHKVGEDPDVLWTLLTERAERWKRERALTVDERANLEAEEKRLEAAIGRLLDHLEAGEDVGLRLKQRRAELDALRVRMAEPEGSDLDEVRFEKELAKNAGWLRWHGPVIKANDVAQTRAAMRALGIGKITVTPTQGGWRFEGDGSLAGMVHSGSGRAPKPPALGDGPA
jgi:hypothetical protein